MSHKVIDTVTKKGHKRRQVKSTGHNDNDVEKIRVSREKAITRNTQA